MTDIASRLGLNGRRLWIIPLVLGVLAILAPWLGVGPGDLRQWMIVAILALTVSGLNLAWGYGGELALGQLAMYALGAYVSGWMAVEGYDLALAIVVAALAAAALGLVT